jgi:chorismate mutase
MTATLADLRVQIDALDNQLLTLLNQRARGIQAPGRPT